MSATLFENYEVFVKDHSEDISSPNGALKMVTDNGMFRAYLDALTEGLDEGIKRAVEAVAVRQREMLLTESSNVPATAFSLGWTVLSFPILVDIYSEPIIAELCNVYPVSTPTISIPRVRIKAITKSYDGTVTTETTIPTATTLVRPNQVNVNIAPNTNTNIFTVATLDPAKMKMNRRYTMITALEVQETWTSGGGGTQATLVPVTLRPDNRNQLVGEVTFTDNGGTDVVISLNGHINYDTGVISFQTVFTTGSATYTFATNYATFTLRFIPTHTMDGRTKVRIETEIDSTSLLH